MLPFRASFFGVSNPFADAFSRADQNLEASPAWTLLQGPPGGLAIQSGRIVATSFGSYCLYACRRRDTGRFTTQARLYFPNNGNGPAIAAYIVDSANYVSYRIINQTTLCQTTFVAGNVTDAIISNVSLASGGVMRVETNTYTQTFAIYYDGVLIRTDPFPSGIAATGRLTGLAGITTAANLYLDDFLTDNL